MSPLKIMLDDSEIYSDFTGYCPSPIGNLRITGDEKGIISIDFTDEEVQKNAYHPVLDECLTQLDEYFKGNRKVFSLRIQPFGTEFQKMVWHELYKVPFGQTVSYIEIARRIGDEKAIRAVGNANNKNKIPIIIPCHRIIGHDGSLVGYAGGLWRKKWLLKHESIISGNDNQFNQLSLF